MLVFGDAFLARDSIVPCTLRAPIAQVEGPLSRLRRLDRIYLRAAWTIAVQVDDSARLRDIHLHLLDALAPRHGNDECTNEDDANATEPMTVAATFPATRTRPGGPPSFDDGDGVGGVGMSGDSCDAEDVEVCETDHFSSRSCLSLVLAGNSRFNADILFMLALVA